MDKYNYLKEIKNDIKKFLETDYDNRYKFESKDEFAKFLSDVMDMLYYCEGSSFCVDDVTIIRKRLCDNKNLLYKAMQYDLNSIVGHENDVIA